MCNSRYDGCRHSPRFSEENLLHSLSAVPKGVQLKVFNLHLIVVLTNRSEVKESLRILFSQSLLIQRFTLRGGSSKFFRKLFMKIFSKLCKTHEKVIQHNHNAQGRFRGTAYLTKGRYDVQKNH
jgi:hypothetical protein